MPQSSRFWLSAGIASSPRSSGEARVLAVGLCLVLHRLVGLALRDATAAQA